MTSSSLSSQCDAQTSITVNDEASFCYFQHVYFCDLTDKSLSTVSASSCRIDILAQLMHCLPKQRSAHSTRHCSGVPSKKILHCANVCFVAHTRMQLRNQADAQAWSVPCVGRVMRYIQRIDLECWKCPENEILLRNCAPQREHCTAVLGRTRTFARLPHLPFAAFAVCRIAVCRIAVCAFATRVCRLRVCRTHVCRISRRIQVQMHGIQGRGHDCSTPLQFNNLEYRTLKRFFALQLPVSSM